MVNGSITADTKWNDTLMENTQRNEHGDTTGSIIYKRKKQYKMQHNIPRMGTYNKCRGPIPNLNGMTQSDGSVLDEVHGVCIFTI